MARHEREMQMGRGMWKYKNGRRLCEARNDIAEIEQCLMSRE